MTKLKRTILTLINKLGSRALFKMYRPQYLEYSSGIVITFHRVLPLSAKGKRYNEFIEIGAENFKRLLVELQKLEVEFLSMKQLQDRLEGKTTSSRSFVHITFDDGYEDNYSIAFPILKELNIPFTLFITTGFIEQTRPFLWWYLLQTIIQDNASINFEKYNLKVEAGTYSEEMEDDFFIRLCDLLMEYGSEDRAYFEEKIFEVITPTMWSSIPAMLTWAQVNEMKDSGLCTLGVHTINHPRTGKLTNEERYAEIAGSKQHILVVTGIVCNCYSYPFGAAADLGDVSGIPFIFEQAGINVAFTTVPAVIDKNINLHFIPRVFFNDSFNTYTLMSRVSGAYQITKKGEDVLYGTS